MTEPATAPTPATPPSVTPPDVEPAGTPAAATDAPSDGAPTMRFGMTAALEPIGLARRIPLGETLRIALLGNDERMSATRALQIGLVSEVVPREQLWEHADGLARIIAAKPPAAIQGTVRAIWESLDSTRTQALRTGLSYTQLGNPIGTAQVDRSQAPRPKWTLR